MKAAILFLFALSIQLIQASNNETTTMKACEFDCPMDCPYGVSHQENKERGCIECICRETLCDTVRCRAGFVCKMSTIIDGCELPEMCAYKAECVPIERRGICPVVSMDHLILNEDNHKCSNDTECKDSLKCCKLDGDKSLCLGKK